jgi:Cof subfamily protein (haloacid dehalogenase superfamily)
MKQPYKLLVVDIDGTLMNSRGAISAEDIEAITKARRMGVTVAVSTGRAAMASKWVLEQLGLDGYHIFFDGALVSNPHTNHEIYAETINRDLIRQTIDTARKSNLHVDVYSSSRYFADREDWAVEIRRRFFRIEPTIANLNDVVRKERIIKGTLIVRTDAEKAQAIDIEKQLRGKLAFSWTMTPAYPEVDFINIVSPEVSKGTALEALCAFLKVPLSQVIAIGDGVNDVSLLKKAGLAVAMSNCVAELKTVAHTLTHDVDHSGVAEAVRKWVVG